MKVLIVGGGGREHAIALKIKENPEVTALYAAPGNGGIAQIATCLPFKATDVDGIVRWAAENKVDFVIVAPDDPLCLGMVDALAEQGIPAFGPRKNAAIIEGSKVFSKNLMKKYGIPTAAYETFDDYDEAVKYLQTADMPIVVKADGLALGKGVLICPDRESAVEAVASMMKEAKFGASGARVVIEEFLTGPEVSVLAFTDGKTVKPMVSSMDHKRALDHDEGLNTGGMGTIAPNPCYTPELAQRCMDEIFLPTIAAMNAEGRTFTGCLYFGLMMTPKGPKVIEYNCRFGDPETQVVLPLLESDLFTVMRATTDGTLESTEVRFSDRSACCVVAASDGYPKKYETGFPLTVPDDTDRDFTFVAGASENDSGQTVTSGGRVVGVTSVRDSLEDAVNAAYDRLKLVRFRNMYYRRDIGKRALEAIKK